MNSVLIVSPSPSVQSALMPLPSRHLMRHHTLWKFGPPRQTHAIVAYSPSVRLVCRDWPIVPTENSVRINQHPCGTLIADLVDALSLLASTSESKDWQSLPRPIVECPQVQGVRVAKECGFGSTRVWSCRSRRSGISAPGSQTSMQLACSG